MAMLSEAQEEELEVLRSIYEADPNFKEVETNKFTYKVCHSEEEDDISQAFLLEVVWPSAYPDELPELSLSAFFNNHLSQETRDTLLSALSEQAQENVGEAMTFTLFEWAKENTSEVIAANVPVVASTEVVASEESAPSPLVAKKKEKKEQLTKGQKKRLAVRFGAHAEDRPRGWDWVDIIRHLSRTAPT